MEKDEILAGKLRVDDPALVELLVNQFYAPIYRLAQSILHDSDEADDVAQETFLRALGAWESFEPGTNLRGWLATIAIRLCRDRLRRRRTRQRLETLLQTGYHAVQRAPTPEEALLEREGYQTLWAAVQALDDRHRLPVILRFVHAMPIGEIAQVLEIPEGTVHSRLHHAMRKLGDRLEDWKGDER